MRHLPRPAAEATAPVNRERAPVGWIQTRVFSNSWSETADRFASRFVFPHLLGIWASLYSWLLPRRFSLSEISVSPAAGLEPTHG